MPGSASLQARTRCKFLHVIARSEATWQSVLLAVPQNEKEHFGQIRKAQRICPNSSQLARLLCGENGLPHQCAHWFAMTCRRRRRACECKDVGRGGMQKEEALLRVQRGGTEANSWAVAGLPRQHPLAHVATRQSFACHCEERSDVAIRIPAGKGKKK